MRGERVVLQSPLPLEECVRRLRESVESRSLLWLSPFGGRDFLGKVGDDGEISLKVRRRLTRNDFAPQFYGRLERFGGGTRVDGRLQIGWWATWFMRAWLAFAVAVGAPIFVMTLLGKAEGDAWVGVLVPPVLVLYGLLMPRIGYWFSRGDEGRLLDFLYQVLAARRIPAAIEPQ